MVSQVVQSASLKIVELLSDVKCIKIYLGGLDEYELSIPTKAKILTSLSDILKDIDNEINNISVKMGRK